MGQIVGSSRNKLVMLFALLLASDPSTAQNGYNYPRPDVPLTENTGSAGVRPVVGFPTASSANYPSSPGYTGSVNPTSLSYGFTNSQRTDSTYSTGAGTGTGFAGSRQQTTGYSARNGLGKRLNIPSQTDAIFGPITGGPISASPISTASISAPISATISAGSITAGTIPAGTIPTGPVTVDLESEPLPNNEVNEGDYSAIPGQPIIDYPIYTEAPQTSFQCNKQPLPGWYADVEANCQIFHVCAMNKTYTFICPNGTIFSQKHLVCVWWHEFNCTSAPNFFYKNEEVYDYSKPMQTQPTPGSAYASVRAQQGFQTRQPTGTGSGIYSANVRHTVPSASRGVSGGVAPVGTTAFPSGTTGSGRFTTPTSPSGAFPTGPPTTVPAFGTTLRGGGFAPIQEATFSSSQVSPKPANREYLPPRRS